MPTGLEGVVAASPSMAGLISSALTERQNLPAVALRAVQSINSRTDVPHLRTVALSILSAMATSVPAERLFSLAGLIYEARRMRIGDDSSQSLLFLHSDHSDKLPEIDEEYLEQHSEYFSLNPYEACGEDDT